MASSEVEALQRAVTAQLEINRSLQEAVEDLQDRVTELEDRLADPELVGE